MTKSQRTRSSFVRGFLRGIAAPAELYRPFDVRFPQSGPVDALRSDWVRIAADFRSVFAAARNRR